MDIYIHQHGKIGDVILCNGLVRYLLKKKFRNNKIYIFCRSRHLKAIKFMYRDQKRIKLIPFNENPKLKDEKFYNRVVELMEQEIVLKFDKREGKAADFYDVDNTEPEQYP